MRKFYAKKKLYLLIPIIFASFWIFLSLFKDNFYLFNAVDFDGFYIASRKIYLNPGAVYVIETPGNQHYYLPSFATLLGMFTVFTSYEVSMVIFFVILYLITILLIFEFDKLLIISKMDNKITRLFLLIVIFNSYSFFINFDYMQCKLIPIYLLVLFLRREIQYRRDSEKYSENKFLFVQMMIFVFALGTLPQYIIFFSIIYLFHGISWKGIFKKSQLKKYGLFILALLVQNFMLFIIIIDNPETISFLLSRTTTRSAIIFHGSRTPSELVELKANFPEVIFFFVLHFIDEFINLSFLNGNILALFSIGIMLITSILLAFQRTMRIEIKMAYFSLIVICFSLYYRILEIIIFIPLVALLFVDRLNSFNNPFDFLRKNFVWIIGLLSIQLINIVPKEYYFYIILPILYDFPVFVIFFPLLIFYTLFLSSIYTLRIHPILKKIIFK